MKLTDQAITALTEKSRIRNLIAAEFGCLEITVSRWVGKNDPNGDLTKRKAIEIISRETGMTEEEILTQEPAQA